MFDFLKGKKNKKPDLHLVEDPVDEKTAGEAGEEFEEAEESFGEVEVTAETDGTEPEDGIDAAETDGEDTGAEGSDIAETDEKGAGDEESDDTSEQDEEDFDDEDEEDIEDDEDIEEDEDDIE